MSKSQIKTFLIIVLVLVLSLTIVRCFPSYQGDGELLRRGTFSFTPTYQIYFPSFSLKVGKISLNYRFQGVIDSELDLRLYFLSKSNKRIMFRSSQQRPKFLEAIKIAVELKENGKEVLNLNQVELIFGGNLYYFSTAGRHLRIPFSSTATYELKIVMEAKIAPPVPLKMQFALSHGHGCPMKPCEEVLWDNLLKN